MTDSNQHIERLDAIRIAWIEAEDIEDWNRTAQEDMRYLFEQYQAALDALSAVQTHIRFSEMSDGEIWFPRVAELLASNPASSPSTVRRPLDKREEPAEWYQHADSDPASSRHDYGDDAPNEGWAFRAEKPRSRREEDDPASVPKERQ